MKPLNYIWTWIVKLFSPQTKQTIKSIIKPIRIKKKGSLHKAMKNAGKRYSSTKGFAIS